MTALDLVKQICPNVTQVKDANRNLNITVTKADANSRAVRNHQECALAQACYRTHIAEQAIIARKVVYLIKGNVATRYTTPESVAREIVSFDRNAGFEPGEYELQKPSPTARLGASKNHGQKLNKRKNSGKLIHKTANIRTDLREIK